MIPLFVLAILGQLADTLTFGMTAAKLGTGGESNPIAAALYDHGGMPAITLFKFGFLALTLFAMRWLHTRWMRVAVVSLTGLLGLFGAFTNIAAT